MKVLFLMFACMSAWAFGAEKDCSYHCQCHEEGREITSKAFLECEWKDYDGVYQYGPRFQRLTDGADPKTTLAAACVRLNGEFNVGTENPCENWYMRTQCQLLPQTVSCQNEVQDSWLKNSDPMTLAPADTKVVLTVPAAGIRVIPGQRLACFGNGKVVDCQERTRDGMTAAFRVDTCWLRLKPVSQVSLIREGTYELPFTGKPRHVVWKPIGFPSKASIISYVEYPVNAPLVDALACNLHTQTGFAVYVPLVGSFRRNFAGLATLVVPPIR